MRHTANSIMADAGVVAETRAAQTGHRPAVDLAVYSHASMKAKKEALAKTGPRLYAVPDQAQAG